MEKVQKVLKGNSPHVSRSGVLKSGCYLTGFYNYRLLKRLPGALKRKISKDIEINGATNKKKSYFLVMINNFSDFPKYSLFRLFIKFVFSTMIKLF